MRPQTNSFSLSQVLGTDYLLPLSSSPKQCTITLQNYTFPTQLPSLHCRGQRASWSQGVAGPRSRERTFCAREMQHWFPPAEHKQTAEWLVGPHSLEVLIGFCVSQEAAGRSSNGHCLMMMVFVIWEGQ